MKTLEEQIACKCIHFNGIMSKECKAGISYASVRIEGDGPYKFPCLKQGGECPSAKFLTDSEVKKKVEDIESHGLRTIAAMIAIKDYVSNTKVTFGKIPCECGGELHFTVAQLNGHVHAKCNSCTVAFME